MIYNDVDDWGQLGYHRPVDRNWTLSLCPKRLIWLTSCLAAVGSLWLCIFSRNDEWMLPFFFRHYDPLVDRYFIYNVRSTDAVCHCCNPTERSRRCVSNAVSKSPLCSQIDRSMRPSKVVDRAVDASISMYRKRKSTFTEISYTNLL